MMIIKIHSRGVGSGKSPIDYLLGENRDREEARLDRGDPEQMIELIDSIDYAQKYTSGVLSFAERDLDERQKQQIMDSFERTLLPSLDKDQYSILWVQHQDKERLELNFVVANVELQSGKRLQPYYDKADRPRLNAWKDLINDHYGLHDPNDPMNKRELCTPNNLPRHKQKASQTITDGLLKVAESGRIQNREDVIQTLEHAGFEIARKTPKTISIKDPDGGKNIRLKGKIYEQDFRFSQELRADIEEASDRYRANRGRRLEESREKLNRFTERKRESNQLRYQRTEYTDTPDYIKKLDDRLNRYHHSDSVRMGGFNLSGLQNRKELRSHSATEPSYSRPQEQRGQRETTGLHRQQESQTALCIGKQGRSELEQWQFNDSDGVLKNDRIRKALARSTGTDAEASGAERQGLTADVRAYTAGQSSTEREFQKFIREYQNNRPDPKRELEQISTACEQLERSVRGLQNTKHELNQAITSVRNASEQVKEINEPRQSYTRGFRM